MMVVRARKVSRMILVFCVRDRRAKGGRGAAGVGWKGAISWRVGGACGSDACVLCVGWK